MFSSWYEDVHVVWVKLLEHFCHFFHIVNLVIFHPQYIDNGHLLWSQSLLQFCTGRFWNFAYVFFMVWRCACGLDIIVRLFLSLFPHCVLCNFSPSIYRQWVPLVSAIPLTVLYRLIWNFAYVFFMVWGCACGLYIIVILFFDTFSTLWTYSFFSHFIHKHLVPLVSATPLTVLRPIIMKLCMCFLHGMRICTWFGCNC